MYSISTFPCIITMISNFLSFFVFYIFIFKFLFTIYYKYIAFLYDSCCSFLNEFLLKLIIFITYSAKDSQNVFVQSLPLYMLSLFSMLLNGDILDNEKPNGICLPTFVADEFSGLFWHPSILYSTLKIFINNNLCFIKFFVFIKV